MDRHNKFSPPAIIMAFSMVKAHCIMSSDWLNYDTILGIPFCSHFMGFISNTKVMPPLTSHGQTKSKKQIFSFQIKIYTNGDHFCSTLLCYQPITNFENSRQNIPSVFPRNYSRHICGQTEVTWEMPFIYLIGGHFLGHLSTKNHNKNPFYICQFSLTLL